MENFGGLIASILGLLAVIIFALDLRAKRKDKREELDFRKQQFDLEKDERREKLEWLKRETLRITEVADLLADGIMRQMRRDISWASEALDKANIKPRSQSLFADRFSHFREEKEHLANCFVPVLLNRCKCLVNEGNTVFPPYKCDTQNILPNLFFPFDRLPDNWYLQVETEFPHPNTRREDFLRDFFFVRTPATWHNNGLVKMG